MSMLEGEMKYYYPGNIIAVIGDYKKSLKNGKWVYYNRSGKIITQVENYKLGDYEGYYAEWSERDGTPKLNGAYKQGKKNAKWTYFDETGKLEKDSSFFVGYIHGSCTEYYQNGTEKSESNYYFSNPTGKRTEWDETGKVVKEDFFDSIEEVKKKMAIKEKEKKKKQK